MGETKKKAQQQKEESIKGSVGGQAVIEGVMMKSKDHIAIAVRRESGEIVKKLKPYKAAKDKHKILNIPIIRGFVNFIEMMAMSMSTLNDSAEMLGLDETDETSKPKSPGEKTEGSKIMLVASIVGTVLGLALSLGLFFVLPTFLGSKITEATSFEKGGWFISLLEMLMRLVIFIAYILLVTLMKDIRRTFEYHGAEHMSVFCYEAGEELTVENAKKYPRFHPRCGTSFLIVMMLIGFVISIFIPNFTHFGFSDTAAYWLRLCVKLAVFPFIIGIGYEFIKYAGKHESALVKIVSAPGLWIQRLTTKKPDEEQIEVAVLSLRAALKIDPVEEAVEQAVLQKEEEAGNVDESAN